MRPGALEAGEPVARVRSGPMPKVAGEDSSKDASNSVAGCPSPHGERPTAGQPLTILSALQPKTRGNDGPGPAPVSGRMNRRVRISAGGRHMIAPFHDVPVKRALGRPWWRSAALTASTRTAGAAGCRPGLCRNAVSQRMILVARAQPGPGGQARGVGEVLGHAVRAGSRYSPSR